MRFLGSVCCILVNNFIVGAQFETSLPWSLALKSHWFDEFGFEKPLDRPIRLSSGFPLFKFVSL